MKLKKVLAITLASFLALSAMILPLSVSAVQTSLIDTTQTGSVTIHKYEIDNAADYAALSHAGTGTTADAAYVPAGAQPLQGVEFTLKKVAEVNSTYYTPSGVNLPTVAEATSASAIGNNIAVTTNAQGIASFNNLPLGIYLVKETSSPSQVVAPVDDFVISVPMTSVDGTQWNYNLDLYPKNQTAYADLTFKKVDYESSSTVLTGAQFKLEKYVNGSYTTVSNNLTTGANGTVQATHLPYNTQYKLTETVAPTGYILDKTNNETVFSVGSDGKISSITSGPGSLDSAKTTLTVTNSKPAISKKIDKSNGALTSLVNETTYGYNEPGNSANYYYAITVKTPNVALSKLSKFTVTDSINGLYGPPVQVDKVVKAEGKTAVASDQYTVSTGYSNLTFNFKTGDGSTIEPNTEYIIVIKSLLNANTGTELNNTASLQYATETGESTTQDPKPTNTIASNTTRMGFGGYKALKINKANEPLTGVEFKLYRTQADAVAGTNPVTARNGLVTSTSTITDTFTTDSNGYLNIGQIYYGDNIDTGSMNYWLVETKTNAGYNLLSAPVQITVNKTSHIFDSSTSVTIINTTKTNLPLTGGTGFMMIVGIGVLLITGASAIFFIRRRKTNAE